MARRALALLLPVLVLALPLDAAVETGSTIEILVESPSDGELVKNKVHLARVQGQAQADNEGKLTFDVMLAIDVSYSTRMPSGIDVDEDGEIGFNPQQELVAPGTYPDGTVCSDPQDTILGAEIKAANLLLGALKPGKTRVGVVTFSGEVGPRDGAPRGLRPEGRLKVDDARSRDDFDAVRAVLSELILDRRAFAARNQLRCGQSELVGGRAGRSLRMRSEHAAARGAQGRALPHGRRSPPSPIGASSVQSPIPRATSEAAISAARLARKAGVVINTYALGAATRCRPRSR